jgi:hypothetical protein
MSFGRFPKPERKKEEAPDPVGELKHAVDVLEAEKERRGLNVPEGGPELAATVQRILADQEKS